MKRIIFLFITLLSLTLTISAQNRELVILHTNDTHSQIEPFTYKADTNVGGFLRREAVIRETRGQHPDMLLFDAGDFCQGTPYFNFFKGQVEVKLMNAMGYDAATLGNHEFDNGCTTLGKLLRKAKFPIVCANYEFLNKKLRKAVKPHVIIQRGDLKIGVFGLLADLKPLVAPSVSAEMHYLDPVECARKSVAELKAQGCQLIVCLSHLGIGEGTTNDLVVAQKVPGIDIIIGGHSHFEMKEPRIVNGTHIYQMTNKGKCIGKITLTY
jgi:5''-nucleotidase/2'',3''-cyclic phosphodiesterase and related esterases